MPRRYCDRNALRQHKRDSSFHWICEDCDEDYEEEDELIDHWIESSNHFYCRECDEHFDSNRKLKRHINEEHWYCRECDKFLDSEGNLDAHLRSSAHQPRNVECPFDVCERVFVSRGHLFLHLEYGVCDSGTNLHDVNRIVRLYDRKLIVIDEDGDYKCSDCESYFGKLSGLVQHIESQKCDASDDNRIHKTLSGILRRITLR